MATVGDTPGGARRNTDEVDTLGDIQGLPRGAVAEGNVHGVAMRSDTNCKGQPMVSGE